MSNKPNPGSKEAQVLGCVCPVLDNSYGKGYLGDGEKFGFIMNDFRKLNRDKYKIKCKIFY